MDIAGFTIETKYIVYASVVAFLAAILFWNIRSFLTRRELFKLFEVSTSGFRLLGTTLISLKHPIKLKKGNIRGIPDAVFLKNDNTIAYVCQYNPRVFKGRPKVRERYQMLLLMGMVMEKYKPVIIKGAIRYHDHLEFISFEPEIYQKLQELQNEYSEAIQEWVAPDNRPLFNRIKTI